MPETPAPHIQDGVSRTATTAGDEGRRTDEVRCVLVAGNSRSGTTMLARMLGTHSEVFTLQELHFTEELWLPDDTGAMSTTAAIQLADRLLHNQRAWYHTRYVPGTHRELAERVVASVPPPVTGPAVFGAVLEHEARAAGKRIAVEQTPRNVFYLEQLLDLLPGSRAVVLTRDPRDVLLSQKNWWRRRFRGTTGVPWRTTLRQWADYHPVTTSLIWRGGIRAGLRVADRADVTVVRFEDLVDDPQGVLEGLLADLGLELEPEMLRVPRISSSNSTNREGTGVDPSVVGRFAEGLSRAEIWVSQRLTRTEAERLGYPAVPVRPPASALVGLALLWPLKLSLAVLLNRQRSRSLFTSVARRLRP